MKHPTHTYRIPRTFGLVLLCLSVPAFLSGRPATAAPPIRLAGLDAPVQVIRDNEGVAHVYAKTRHDAYFMQGYLQAQDRFFQLDHLRRLFGGTLAELLGQSVLGLDLRFRSFGLRRAAEESFAAHPEETKRWLQAFADGVNASLEANPLPPEYEVLELTKAGIPRWSPVDTLIFLKGAGLPLGQALGDLSRTLALDAYQREGQARGFDGTRLFFDDLFRVAPIDPAVSFPGFAGEAGVVSRAARRSRLVEAARALPEVVRPEALALAERHLREIEESPVLKRWLNRVEGGMGSNVWVIDGQHTESGLPILASDPHNLLDSPPFQYPIHLVVSGPPGERLDIHGANFVAIPGHLSACNEAICFAVASTLYDEGDAYQERVILGPDGVPTHTLFRGEREPLVVVAQSYRVNRIGDGVQDTLEEVPVAPMAGGLTFLVPRRNFGPLIGVSPIGGGEAVGVSLQHTGGRFTADLEAIRRLALARDLASFEAALEFWDFSSFMFAYVDREGNVGLFSTGENPLREDLETLAAVDGLPPFLLRDGTGQRRNEWLPAESRPPGRALSFAVLPTAELPRRINPPEGFLFNSNNDPVGATLDNDPLNQLRPNGGIYYLSNFYRSLRAGKVRQLLSGALAGGGRVSLEDVMRFQANHEMVDAERLVPHIAAALEHARTPGAWPQLAALAEDAAVAEAVARLAAWDFSTPTGILDGYDPGDDPESMPDPSSEEVAHSVAATLFSVWRSQMIRTVVDGTLAGLGLGGVRPPDLEAYRALVHLLETFPSHRGVGASGVDFFPASGAPSREAGRDLVILQALRQTLDLLASDAFANAFGHSTDQDDYRWGRLHRIVFDHPLGGPFNIPSALSEFSDLGAGLPGMARPGGFEVVDAGSHAIRAASDREFMFGAGAMDRFIGIPSRSGPSAYFVLAGGTSGDPGSPFFGSQMGRWLTNQYTEVRFRRSEVEKDKASKEVFLPGS